MDWDRKESMCAGKEAFVDFLTGAGVPAKAKQRSDGRNPMSAFEDKHGKGIA